MIVKVLVDSINIGPRIRNKSIVIVSGLFVYFKRITPHRLHASLPEIIPGRIIVNIAMKPRPGYHPGHALIVLKIKFCGAYLAHFHFVLQNSFRSLPLFDKLINFVEANRSD